MKQSSSFQYIHGFTAVNYYIQISIPFETSVKTTCLAVHFITTLIVHANFNIRNRPRHRYCFSVTSNKGLVQRKWNIHFTWESTNTIFIFRLQPNEHTHIGQFSIFKSPLFHTEVILSIFQSATLTKSNSVHVKIRAHFLSTSVLLHCHSPIRWTGIMQ
jgi:hypothetical protein